MKYQIKTSLIIGLFLLCSVFAHTQDITSQEKQPLPFYQRIDASYIIGAQVFNDNFIYNPGMSLDMSFGYFLNNNVGLGLGTGYKSFESEAFLPIYGEIIGYKKNKTNTPIIKLQLGYSIGWDKTSTRVEGYDFGGGIFLGAGGGRKIKIKNDISVLFQWSYQHQFAKMEYNIFNTREYKEILSYDMIVITIGILRES